MSDNSRENSNNVEMPDIDDDFEKLPEAYRSGSIKPVLILVAMIAVAFLLVYLFIDETEEQVMASIPVLEKAWVISRVEGTEIASNADKTVVDGRGVMLYMLLYGVDETTDERYYYIDAPADTMPRIVIDGAEIPPNKIRRFEYPNVKTIVFWYKYEVSPKYYIARHKEKNEGNFDRLWTFSRGHNMGNRLWAFADPRDDLLASHDDYAGTMRYTAECSIFVDGESEKRGMIDTRDADTTMPRTLPPRAHRVSLVPEKRSGLDAYYRAFFNVISREDWESPEQAAEMTENYLGGSSRSILIGAIRLMGYEVDYQNENFLADHAELLFDNVILDDFRFFRTSSDSNVITFGEGGIMNGDIIECQGRYLVFVREEETAKTDPSHGVLTGKDHVLDAYNKLPMPSYANEIAEMQGAIRIWRLKPRAGE